MTHIDEVLQMAEVVVLRFEDLLDHVGSLRVLLRVSLRRRATPVEMNLISLRDFLRTHELFISSMKRERGRFHRHRTSVDGYVRMSEATDQ